MGKKARTELGRQILIYCAQNNVTQTELAKQAGTTTNALWEMSTDMRPRHAARERVEQIIGHNVRHFERSAQ